MQDQPRAKNHEVATEWVDGELVVYDPETKTAHCLSADAAAVWERCDGQTPLQNLADACAVDLTVAERAVEELRDRGLLEDAPPLGRGYSRREAATRFAKVGGAALLAPLVYSVAIPSAAVAAVSKTPDQGTCNGNGNCISGHCVSGICCGVILQTCSVTADCCPNIDLLGCVAGICTSIPI
jgi:hypothetical protein